MEDKIPQESGLTIVDEFTPNPDKQRFFFKKKKIFGSRILDEWRF